jgi:hypothetical protein
MIFLLDLQLVPFRRKISPVLAKMSSPSILTVDTEMTKRSAKSNAHDFYHKNFNHSLLPKAELERYRNDIK